jgi:hypothetical protein
MTRSILGNGCGKGNATWALGWKIGEELIGAKELILEDRNVGTEDVVTTLASCALVVSSDMLQSTPCRVEDVGKESDFSIARRFRFACTEDLPSCSSTIVIVGVIFSLVGLWSSVILIGVVRQLATTRPERSFRIKSMLVTG